MVEAVVSHSMHAVQVECLQSFAGAEASQFMTGGPDTSATLHSILLIQVRLSERAWKA